MAVIIIVDDEVELRENLQDLLEFKGHEVTAFETGEELLEKYESINFDLILLDYQLPGLNGIELIPMIKEKYAEIPIALVTASSQQNTMEEAIKSGADRIILKPYSPGDMLQAVDEMLGKTTE